ncbi:MAG TPA: GNAT family N-acetyltransferase [Chloroflexota bacterium]|nr:GNAT family N-acetyltransferase [Chloroflexota bacterium]
MTLAIRRMVIDDLEPAARVATAAYGRPSSIGELQRYLALQPDGWLVAEWAGALAGLVGAVDYGDRAWVGLMAVDPPLQGRGIARALMEALLEWLDGRRCPTVVLDASDAGAPLYEKLGFVDVDLIDAYRLPSLASLAPASAPSVSPLTNQDLSEATALDAAAFGHARGAVLRSLVADHGTRAFIHRDAKEVVDGYLIAQSLRIGPWVASTLTAARDLLTTALALPYADGPTVQIPRANLAGRTLLEEHGFTLHRSLRHMRRGDPPARDRRDLRYGQASFTLG